MISISKKDQENEDENKNKSLDEEQVFNTYLVEGMVVGLLVGACIGTVVSITFDIWWVLALSPIIMLFGLLLGISIKKNK